MDLKVSHLKTSTRSAAKRSQTGLRPAVALVLVAIGLYAAPLLAVAEFSVNEVVPGIFLHEGRHEEMSSANQGDIVNCGYVVGRDAVAVIDPGGSVQTARLLRESIRQHTNLPIRFVVLTHIHPDHIAGLAAFADVPQVVAHHHYPRALAQRGDFYLDRFPELFGSDRQASLRVPDLLVNDTMSIDLGERRLTLQAWSTGHTDNDLTVLDEMTDTLFASDLLFSTRTPSVDGSLIGWLSVLEELARKPRHLVIPGHGSPASLDLILIPQRRYLSALRDGVRLRLGRGESLAQVVEDAQRDANVWQWQLFDRVHPMNITKAYTELEWE